MTADAPTAEYAPCACDPHGERTYCMCPLVADGWAAPNDVYDMSGMDAMLELPTIQVRRGGILYPFPHITINVLRVGWRKWALIGVTELDSRQVHYGVYKSRKAARKQREILYATHHMLYNIWFGGKR